MLSFALNHATAPALSVPRMVDLSEQLGMVGVELRIERGVAGTDTTVLALAEVAAFNAAEASVLDRAVKLMDMAVAHGIGSIVLIPQVGMRETETSELTDVLDLLGPELAARGLTGLIEPIGFATSTIRTKAEVVRAIETCGYADQFGLVHDTFHHTLAGETEFYPALTNIVHISGVTRSGRPADYADADRGLVCSGDQLGTVAQIAALLRAGYRGAFSFEAFSPDLHSAPDIKGALETSIRFIDQSITMLKAEWTRGECNAPIGDPV
jgi:2-keto-myo-inositol isomerase